MSFKSFNFMGIIVIFCLALFVGNVCLAQRPGRTAVKSQITANPGSEPIIKADRDFAKMAADSGMAKAFAFFAADSATIFRRNSAPIVGREAIRAAYEGTASMTLQWEPYFAEMAGSNDIGYTLGKSQFASKDSTGLHGTVFGYYVTIWKKQPDGSWKYVLDTGITAPPPKADTTGKR